MKKMILGLCFGSALIFGCKKESSTKPSGTTTPPAKDGFFWKEDSGAEIQADSAFWTTWSSGTGIRAYKNGMANFFEINWAPANATAVGDYSLTTPYGATFLKGSDTYTISSTQTIHITGFSSDKLSGNFTLDVTGPSIKKISANFNNIPKK